MRICCALLLVALFHPQLKAQGPSWLWAQGYGSAGQDRSRAICADGNGGFYLTGYFTGTGITIGGTALTNTQSNNSADLFLSRVAADGSFLWTARIGGTGSQAGVSVASDAQGRVVLTGTYENTITIGTTTLTSAGGADVFVAKFDADGTALWAVSMGGAASDDVSDLAVGPDGRVAVAGTFAGAGFTAGGITLVNADPGDEDLYVVMLDGTGNVLWADAAGGAFDDTAASVCIDAGGNVIMGGFFATAAIQFGGFTLTNANDNYNDLLLVKYDADGAVLWAKRAGGPRHERIWAVACHANGDIAVAGGFIDATLVIDGTELTNTNSDQSWYDAFVARFNGDGVLLWAVSGGGIYDEFVTAVDVDAAGNTVLAGDFDSPQAAFGGLTLTNVEDYDAFVVQFDPSGNASWARSAGGGNGDRTQSVACGTNGTVALTGYSTSEPLAFGSHQVMNNGDADLWLALLGIAAGLPDAAANGTLRAYPGIGSGAVRITSAAAMHELRVIDAGGRTVVRTAPMAPVADLELSVPGCYTVLARTAQGTARTRVAVVR